MNANKEAQQTHQHVSGLFICLLYHHCCHCERRLALMTHVVFSGQQERFLKLLFKGSKNEQCKERKFILL